MAWNSRTNNKPEKEIEEYLVDKIKDLGGMCPKWNSPGTKGVPDRIVLLPDALICFVETKREKGGRISPMQEWRARQLKQYGFVTFFINTKPQVDKLVASLMKGKIPDAV